MRIVRATPIDNDKLSSYFSSISLPGVIDFNFQRIGSFFNLYRLQSDEYTTYVLLDDQSSPVAMASLLFRRVAIEGHTETVCFATDLRVSPARGAVLSWSQHFLPILEKEKEKHQCQYVFSMVTQNQKIAHNAFLRPRSMKRKLPRYFLFRKFHIVSIHGIWPFRSHPLRSIRIHSYQDSDHDSLVHYLHKKKSSKPLSFAIKKEDIEDTVDRWKDLNWSHFLLAKDNKGNLLGCVAPWSSIHIQRFVPLHYSPQVHTLKEGLHLLSLLGKAKKLPLLNNPFEFSYLTHLLADNPDVFHSLIDASYFHVPKQNFLVYTHFDQHWLTTPPRGFISTSLPGGLYCLLSPEQAVPDFLKPSQLNDPPDFELAYW